LIGKRSSDRLAHVPIQVRHASEISSGDILSIRGLIMQQPVPPQTTRRLALFLDGTWNEVSDNTNIWRFRALFAPVGADGCTQLGYYSTGLGTKFGEKIRGGMFGVGIDTAITSAYEWLMEHYQLGDEIFIFGFSRGAYTARSLSGFVSKCGLLQSGAPLGVNQLFMRYRRSGPYRPPID
jgi:uncharacterized protein (DUF2235 family)